MTAQIEWLQKIKDHLGPPPEQGQDYRVWHEKTDEAIAAVDAAIEAIESQDRLRSALEQCDHKTSSMRIWSGMEYTYHPLHAKRIHEIARAALDHKS